MFNLYMSSQIQSIQVNFIEDLNFLIHTLYIYIHIFLKFETFDVEKLQEDAK